jgi:hypothetical protein
VKQPIRRQRSPRQELAQHDHAELETTEGRKAFNDKCSASIAETIANGGTCIEAIHTACAKVAATLPRKTKDPNANWFSMNEDDMTATIGKRNAAKKTHEQALRQQQTVPSFGEGKAKRERSNRQEQRSMGPTPNHRHPAHQPRHLSRLGMLHAHLRRRG